MAESESIFSLRLVIADFYMEKPILGLDPVYSEFRGKEIKKVPIIRVFGSSAQGQKTCMHVHGVFPYFYIPYDRNDFESVNKAMYQVAINLDKAINISLSQGSSSVQHVFKVQLVKGIPFYGYHRSEHQYLKIYMFNPRFVRRAANLLQNGAILNKNFHPHEAHVPYVLQFMIDYNLYGMSFIHIPSEIVKFRRSNNDDVIPYTNLKSAQILDCELAKKLSCSTLECDIGSNFILNRFQLISKTTNAANSNPGIESIWNDEKLRRQKLAQTFQEDEEKLKAIPPLEAPPTQERPNVYPTESEIFYRTALVSKLLAMETSMMENTQLSDQTIDCTLQTNSSNISVNSSLMISKQQKRTFNLVKMLQNSVYPEECSQNENLVNASFVENHLSNNNAFQQSLYTDLSDLDQSESRKILEDESIFLEDTIVDEELVLSLTQAQNPHVPHNATLRDEDMQLLDILQQLEEDSNNEKIDLDSSLAPLSQNQNKYALSPEVLDKETTAAVLPELCSDTDSDRDDVTDDNIHDFSIALENLDDLILKLTQTATETSILSALPQNDGSDDLPKTPTKSSRPVIRAKTPPRTPTTPTHRRLSMGSPSRSPKTPKSGHKYKALPLIITNRSTGKKILTNLPDDSMTPCKETVEEKSRNLSSLLSMRKKLAMTELRRKSISLETEDVRNNFNEFPSTSASSNITRRRSKRIVNLDKTHVTCNLTPRRTNEKLLKVYSVENNEKEPAAMADEPKEDGNSHKNIPIKVNKNTNNVQCFKGRTRKKDTDPIKSSDKEANQKGNNTNVEEENNDSPLRHNNSEERNTVNMQQGIEEDNEEILDSEDSEISEYQSVHLRKTPNLKRLRRSFLSTQCAKRRKFVSNHREEMVINSSKFEIANKRSEDNECGKKPNECDLIKETDVSKQTQMNKEFNISSSIENVSKESFKTLGYALRKSKRINAHHQSKEDNSQIKSTLDVITNDNVNKEVINSVIQIGTNSHNYKNDHDRRIQPLESGHKCMSKNMNSIPSTTNRNDINSRMLRKCHVRLKKIRNDHPEISDKLEIEKCYEKHIQTKEKIKNSSVAIKPSENNYSEQNSKSKTPEMKKSDLGSIQINDNTSEKNMTFSIDELKQTTRLTTENYDQSKNTINNAQQIQASELSEHVETFRRSQQHVIPSSNDNLLKVVMNLTCETDASIQTKEAHKKTSELEIVELSKDSEDCTELLQTHNPSNNVLLDSVKKKSAFGFENLPTLSEESEESLKGTPTEKMSLLKKSCTKAMQLPEERRKSPRISQSSEITSQKIENFQSFLGSDLSQIGFYKPPHENIPHCSDNLMNALLKLKSEMEAESVKSLEYNKKDKKTTDKERKVGVDNSIELPTITTNDDRTKESCQMGITLLPKLSEESVVHAEEKIFEKNSLAEIEKDNINTAHTPDVSDATAIDNSQPFDTSDVSQQIEPFKAQPIASSKENISNLTSTGKEHESVSKKAVNFSNSPRKSTHESPSIEFTTDSPFTQSSDDEIAETPPTPPLSHIIKTPTFHKLNHGTRSLNSPLIFTQNSSPNIMTQNKKLSQSYEKVMVLSSSSNDHSPPLDSIVLLTPLDLPPTRDEVLKGSLKLKLPEYEFQQPFYSNPDDITKHKEIGFTVLQISSNKLNDVEEFQSILGNDVKGLAAWRRQQLARLGGPEMLTKYRNSQRIREYFATQKIISIEPQVNAPTRQDVKMWIKARELLKNKSGLNEETFDDREVTHQNQEDSPIKIRRQKVTMMLNNEGDDGDSDSTLDCSSMSLSLTPLTPGTPATKDTVCEESIKKSFTPVTSKIERIPLERLNPLRRRHNRRVLKRVSLNQKLKESLDNEKCSQGEKKSQENEGISSTSLADESIIPHSSQNSETSVSSQTVLAEMERSSFMQQIQCNDVNLAGGSHNNSTLNNTFGFKVALENLQQAKADVELNYLTIITLEVFVATRDDLFPNPQIDEIRCLFYAIENSIPNDHTDDNDKKLPRKSCGYIMVHDSRDVIDKEGHIHGLDRDIDVTIVQTEVEALEALLGLCSRWDPDIYAGYEIEMCSWGFVMDRAKYLCLNIAPLLSRVPTQKVRDFQDEDRDQFTDLDAEMKLCGRILLDVWRLMRSEIALTSYTFENVMYHIMHKRCPFHNYRSLSEWYFSPGSRWIVLEYYLERVRGTLALLDQLDLIGRTSEMAKLIGIQFYEVLSRGSQFRVESMMLRIAKPKNLVPVSPSVQQRAHMRAPEYLPLILEPQSRFYADPLIVLDFQSLYPSMIIGYNYCFSTCLGRVEHLGQSTPFEFGASQLRVSPTMLRKLVDRDLITISPCGVVFVKSAVREGILPRMLTEILDTRQMVKQSMKVHKSNSALQRILHSRQLGLKLMANVTYGYTAANFSGRMPAVEVGDSVVSKGRETLERAIKMVEASEKWNVKVVYGDTDSLFVLVPGRDRAEAFRIGEEIAEAVTKQNPHPVKLKLEKVYQPCILQTKKRYVGYMYETPDQKEPEYEAKGIETVRRDGCPIVAKMLEKVLRILFESADVSKVKQYVCRQFTKLLSGRANIQDLIFAKEFRGMNGYRPTACVPALELTRKWIQTDPRRIPRKGERIPFIITNGPPGVPLIRLIRHPHELLADEGLKINAIYYITKAIIPPLNRCMLLIGADVNEWFTNLPRKILMTPALSMANEVIVCPNSKTKKSTISQFFSTTNCIVDCGRQTKQGVCEVCSSNATRSMVILQSKISKIERGYVTTQHICQSCCGRVGDLKCSSLDCPVLYVLEVKRRDLQQITHFRNILDERF